VLPTKRTITHRRCYTDEDLAAALRLPRVPKDRRSVAYCRDSSQAQTPDVLKQQAVLQAYCEQQRMVVDEWITELGGGLTFERQQFLKLVDAIVAGESACVVLAHQDRLARFGYTLLAHVCHTHHCKLVVMNSETLSPLEELVQDLLTITHCFSSRLSGLRNSRKA